MCNYINDSNSTNEHSKELLTPSDPHKTPVKKNKRSISVQDISPRKRSKGCGIVSDLISVENLTFKTEEKKRFKRDVSVLDSNDDKSQTTDFSKKYFPKKRFKGDDSLSDQIVDP